MPSARCRAFGVRRRRLFFSERVPCVGCPCVEQSTRIPAMVRPAGVCAGLRVTTYVPWCATEHNTRDNNSNSKRNGNRNTNRDNKQSGKNISLNSNRHRRNSTCHCCGRIDIFSCASGVRWCCLCSFCSKVPRGPQKLVRGVP